MDLVNLTFNTVTFCKLRRCLEYMDGLTDYNFKMPIKIPLPIKKGKNSYAYMFGKESL